MFVRVDSLKPSSVYYHRVRSENSNSFSAYSDWVGVKTKDSITITDSIPTDSIPTDSTPTGMNDILMSVSIYPNPALDIIHLEGSFMTRLEIIGNSGRIVMSSTIGNDSFDMDIKHLVPGIYHVRIVLGEWKGSDSINY